MLWGRAASANDAGAVAPEAAAAAAGVDTRCCPISISVCMPAHLRASPTLLLLTAGALRLESSSGEGAAAPGRQCRPPMQGVLGAVQGGLRHALTMPAYRPTGTPTTRAIRLPKPMLGFSGCWLGGPGKCCNRLIVHAIANGKGVWRPAAQVRHQNHFWGVETTNDCEMRGPPAALAASLRPPIAACRPRCSPTRRPQRPPAGSHAGLAGLCRFRPALGEWMDWAANSDDTWGWPGRCVRGGWQWLGQSRTDTCCSHRRCCRRRRNQSNLWTPTSQRGVEFPSRAGPESVIYAGQGPPPPSPMVVERFQQVISQLFTQVRRRGGAGGGGRVGWARGRAEWRAAGGRQAASEFLNSKHCKLSVQKRDT